MSDYQLIVIGAGPGGYVAALHAAGLGLRTAVVENRQAGGTCLNRGCVPTKALLHASQLYAEIRSGASAGISAGDVRVDMEAVFARKRQVVEKLVGGIHSMFKNAGVDYLPGTGTITAAGTVQVAGAEGVKTCTADDIIVATGSTPARPPIPGLDLPGVMTSDELLAGRGRLYRSIVIIGGGVIGVEFATFYSDLGCEVTIVEGLDRLLPNMDRELGQSLAQLLKKRGVKLYTGSMVERVVQDGAGLAVEFVSKGAPGSAAGEAVLCAIGRQPNWKDAFAPGMRPEPDGKRIRVDARYQTSIPHVYAVGDAASKVQLAHAASAQGTACVDFLCGRENGVDMSVVPSCVYTCPEIASVGLTEQEAREAGIPVKTGKSILSANARTVIVDGGRAFMKVVARADDHRLVGAQLMCRSSTDMISELSQAIANRMSVEQLLRAMRPHPTFEESLRDALENVLAKLG